MMNPTSPSLQVRPFELKDLDQILEIQNAAYTEALRESTESFISKHGLSPESFWVVVEQSTVLGYLIAQPCRIGQPLTLNQIEPRYEGSPNGLHLHDLAVRPEARGRGVAQALVAAFFKYFEALGLSEASLISVQGSVPFWSKQGFVASELQGGEQDVLETYGREARYMVYHA